VGVRPQRDGLRGLDRRRRHAIRLARSMNAEKRERSLAGLLSAEAA
jgi:hypothetical protein